MCECHARFADPPFSADHSVEKYKKGGEGIRVGGHVPSDQFGTVVDSCREKELKVGPMTSKFYTKH